MLFSKRWRSFRKSIFNCRSPGGGHDSLKVMLATRSTSESPVTIWKSKLGSAQSELGSGGLSMSNTMDSQRRRRHISTASGLMSTPYKLFSMVRRFQSLTVW